MVSSHASWARAFRVTQPIFFGYLPFGMTLGFLMTQQGYPAYFPIALSALTFAGAAVFVVMGLLAVDTSVWMVALSTLLVNGRHVFYGFSLRTRNQLVITSSWLTQYTIFALSDEVFGLLMAEPAPVSPALGAQIAFFAHMYWITATSLGVLLGQVDFPQPLEAAFTFSASALFWLLAFEQLRAEPRIQKPFLCCALVMLCTMCITENNFLILSLLGITAVIWQFDQKLWPPPSQ